MIQVSEESAVRFTNILRNKKDRIKQLEREVVEFNTEIRGLTKRNKKLKSDLQLENCRLTAAFGREDNLKQLHKELQEGCEKIQEENDKLQEGNEKLQKYAHKLANGLPDGILPKDVELLRADNAYLAYSAREVKEELDVVRGIELRTRNERDKFQEDIKQLRKEYESNLEAAREFSGDIEGKRLREENTRLREKNARLCERNARLREGNNNFKKNINSCQKVMNSQNNVITGYWKDIRELKKKVQRGLELQFALKNIRYVLVKSFMPSAAASLTIEQIDKVLE